MAEPCKRWDRWSLPTLLLWMLFLLIGLAPDAVYDELRQLAGVVTQNALVNSSGVITVAFATYVAVFAFLACQEQGMPVPDAWSRCLSLGMLALVAFLPYTYQHWAQADAPILAYHRWLLYAVGPLKLLAWLYLLSLAVRHYALGDRRAFVEPFWPGSAGSTHASAAGHGPDQPQQPQTIQPTPSDASIPESNTRGPDAGACN